MAVCIFGLSSVPGTDFPNVEFRFADKLVHASIYGILAILIAIPLHRARRVDGWGRLILWVTVIGCGYGISDELHQYFTPHRSPDVWDAAADTVGALFGALTYVGVMQWKGKITKYPSQF
jgi:VanZ family protein